MRHLKKRNRIKKIVEDVEKKAVSIKPEDQIEKKIIKERANWGMTRNFAIKFLLESGQINQQLIDQASIKYLRSFDSPIFIEQLEERGSCDDWLYCFERNREKINFNKRASYFIQQISFRFSNRLEDRFYIIKKIILFNQGFWDKDKYCEFYLSCNAEALLEFLNTSMIKFPFLRNANEWISFYEEIKKIHNGWETMCLKDIGNNMKSEISNAYKNNESFRISKEVLLFISSNFCGDGESDFDKIIMKKLIEVTK